MDITYKKVSFHRAQSEEPHRMLTYNHISTLYPSAAELDEKNCYEAFFISTWQTGVTCLDYCLTQVNYTTCVIAVLWVSVKNKVEFLKNIFRNSTFNTEAAP